MIEMSYKQKFHYLAPWMGEILTTVKKELKNEHLRKDPVFTQKYFNKKMMDKITVQDLVEGYSKALEDDFEEAGEWISSRWMLKHTEVYQFFSDKLMAINPNFDQIEKLSDDVGQKLMQAAVAEFGPKITYIFSILNSVVFSEAVYKDLRGQIKEEPKEEIVVESKNPEEMIARITDRYEKKLQGLQKKYAQDVEGLKKQIASLQRRLQDVAK